MQSMQAGASDGAAATRDAAVPSVAASEGGTMKRSDRCEFCLSPQPPFRTVRDKRLGRMVVVCARPTHRGREPLTPRQRETVARRLMRLAAGGAV